MRKTIAILLVLLMMFSVSGLAIAQRPDDVPGPKQSLVALGDSITAGHGLEKNLNMVSRKAYPQLLGDEIGYRVTNLAVSGMTSCEVLEAVQNNSRYRSAIAKADMIILNVGGADMLGFLNAFMQNLHDPPCAETFMLTLGGNINSILSEIGTLNPSVPILLFNIYEPYPVTVGLAADEEYEAIGDLFDFLDGVNMTIASFAASPNVYLVDAYAAFDGYPGSELEKALLLFIDEVHLNETGQELLFDAAYNVLDEADLLYTRPMPLGLQRKALMAQ